MEQRIVCAANRYNGTETVICGARHWDNTMQEAVKHLNFDHDKVEWIQGFIDQRGNFLTRTEAWTVAEKAGQILRRVGGDTARSGTLYSENLY